MVELVEKILILQNTPQYTLVITKEREGQQEAGANGYLNGLPTTEPGTHYG